MTPPVETPDVVDQAAEPQSDLWTSDSERGQTASEALPTGAVDTETGSVEPAPEPVAEAPKADEKAAAAPERDQKGQFQPKGKKRDDPVARMRDATAKEAAAKEEARQAREEAARYKAELDAARRPATAPSPATVAPALVPTGGDFPEFEAWSQATGNSDWNAYNRAAIRYEAQQVAQAAIQRQQFNTQQQTRVATYRQRLQEGVAKYPDLGPMIQPGARTAFDESLGRRGLTAMPQVIAEAVVDSELAPEILRYFGTHPEEGAQLVADVQHQPTTAASVVRRLLETIVAPTAARPESASAVRPSAARPPVTRVGGTANATPTDPDDLEFGPDYIRLENAREAKRREGGRW